MLLWLTDKLIRSFEIQTIGGLLVSSAVITLVNGIFHFADFAQRMGIHRDRADALDLSESACNLSRMRTSLLIRSGRFRLGAVALVWRSALARLQEEQAEGTAAGPATRRRSSPRSTTR